MAYLQDLRYAARVLRRSPAFAAAAIATLALGIGANTAIFSVTNAVLLKPLPYTDPDRLRAIFLEIPQFRDVTPSMPPRPLDFVEWRLHNQVFSSLALFRGAALNLTGQGEPERIDAMRASANLFPTLGVSVERGRGFLPEEDQPGRDSEVILSHDFWMRRFAGNPALLNRSIELEGRTCTVVGILPANFVFPTGKQFHPLLPLPPRIDLWVPMALTPGEIRQTANTDYGVIGRLKPGVNPEQAAQEMDALSVNFNRRENPNQNVDFHTRLVPLRQAWTGNLRHGLILLLAAVGVLLLIACVNLANLLMARMTGRSKEFATRMALGASRLRLVRQLLTESLLLALLGGGAGVLLAMWGTRVAISTGPRDLPMLQQIAVNAPVLWFTFAVALVTGLAFGWLPAIEVSRGFSESRRAGTLRRGLVTVEVALSTALLAAAGLLLHSFVNVMNADRGFGVERIMAIDLALPERTYVEPQRKIGFFRDLARRVGSLPGVVAAGAVTDLPLTNEAENRLLQLESDVRVNLLRPVAAWRHTTPGYFDAMEIPLRAGRVFREQEPAPVTVISQSLAEAVWPGEPPDRIVGRHIRERLGPPLTIIGVVADVRTTALDRRPMPQMYRPYTQGPTARMSLVVRSAEDPESLARAIRGEIRGLDPDLPVPAMRTMRDLVETSVAQRRFQMVLIAIFAGLAMVLAIVGIYGVVSYSVSLRTRDIGLRMALGAQPGRVLLSVLKEGLTPVLWGIGLGAVGAVAAARSLRSLLFGIGPLDTATFAAVTFVLLLAAAAACYVPARWASRLDPMRAVRHD